MTSDRLVTLLRFLEDDPGDAFTRFALAQEYAKRGDVEQALTHYQTLRAEQPEYVGTYFHLGKLLEKAGQKDAALAVYREGIAAAGRVGDQHARAELQDALMKAEMGWDEED